MKAEPLVPDALAEDVIVGLFAVMVKVSVCVLVTLAASVRVTVTLVVPAVVGVPLITASLRLSPPGRVPEVIDHVNGEVPPLPVRVWLSAVPMVPDLVLAEVIVRTFAGVPGDWLDEVPFPALLTARTLIW